MKYIIRTIAQIAIGLSAISMTKIGLWFLIPWVISWAVYDLTWGRLSTTPQG